jgi:hypothetical protein
LRDPALVVDAAFGLVAVFFRALAPALALGFAGFALLAITAPPPINRDNDLGFGVPTWQP